ncbi:DUF5697 family protein [Oscillospiraceae bacterium MB08-C2-2]|nr:DUF5697 family protein [Oscillospiraceae bacterium MB08-C2-2]
MEGGKGPYQITMEYCWQLVQKYSILQGTQLYVLLKRHAGLSKNNRHKLFRALCRQWHIHELELSGIKYLAQQKELQPVGRYAAQIACFWVLLDYFDQVERHFATGSFTRISIEIAGQDYSIVYVANGEERLCMENMKKGGDTRYIAVLEDTGQLPLIHDKKLRAFAVVSTIGEITYYTPREEGL